MNYSKLKLIQKNWSNNIYKVVINNNNFYIKRYPININKIDYNYPLWREIFVLEFINKLKKNKQYFMELYSKSIINCNLKFFNIYNRNKYEKKTFKKCYDLIINDKGENLINLLKSKYTIKEKYKMIIQVVHGLEILRKNKFIHNDVHSENISYIVINKNINIKNKTFKAKYQYSLIDYGHSLHKKFKDKDYNQLYFINFDMLLFIENVILKLLIVYKNIKKEDSKPKFKMEDIQIIFDKYKTTWNKIKKTLLRKGNEYKKWFEIFENGEKHKFYNNFDLEFPVLKNKGNHKINLSIVNEIKILFSAYNRKAWLKEMKCNKNIGNLIPSKDIEFMILNLKNNNKIIKYFLDLI